MEVDYLTNIKIFKKHKPRQINGIVNSYLYDLDGLAESVPLMKQIHFDMKLEFPNHPNLACINKLFDDYNAICLTFLNRHSVMNEEMINNYIDSLNAIHFKLLKVVPKGKKRYCDNKQGKEIKSNYHQRINGALYPITSHRNIDDKSLTPIMKCIIFSFLAIAFVFLPMALNSNSEVNIYFEQYPIISVCVTLISESLFIVFGLLGFSSYFRIKRNLTIYKRSDLNNLLYSLSLAVAILAIILNYIFSFYFTISKN